MKLPIVKYGHPVLRRKGARIEAFTSQVKELIQNMFETMYGERGVGLAAQQVGHALQLTVIDVRGVTDRPSTLEVNGVEADVASFMPLVLVNPEIKPFGEAVSGPEGCLSFPEIFGDINRAERVEVSALDREGKRIVFSCGGLLARAIQHEFDHLQGILFIDRMSKEHKASLRDDLDAVQFATKAALKTK